MSHHQQGLNRRNSGVSSANSASVHSGPTLVAPSKHETSSHKTRKFGLGNISLQNLLQYAKSDPHKKMGRVLQIAQIMVVAIVAATGILAQVYTDAELAVTRSQVNIQIDELAHITTDLYDIIQVLSFEMQAFYEYNTGSYEIFREQAQQPMQDVDTKLIFMTQWPHDLTVLDVKDRKKLASANALRLTLRDHRELRKAPNGTDEAETIYFYSHLIESLGSLVIASTLESYRFDGWKELLSVFYLFEMYISIKKYASTGRKLVKENRTVELNDEIFKNCLIFHWEYENYRAMVPLTSEAGKEKMDNLTQQESTRLVNELHFGYTVNRDFGLLTVEEWDNAMHRHEDDIFWIIKYLRNRIDDALEYHRTLWLTEDIISVVLYTAASVIAVAFVAAHFTVSRRLQNKTAENHEVLDTLYKTVASLHDYMPVYLRSDIKRGILAPTTHRQDICIMILDIANVNSLHAEMSGEDFSEFLTEFFEKIEGLLINYTCFKLDVYGDCMTVVSGAGELHPIDHVAEMLMIALAIRDEFRDVKIDDRALHLRIGVSVGEGFFRTLHLQVPRMAIYGDAIKNATIVHSSGLPSKVHVVEAVAERLREETHEFEFIPSGLRCFKDADTYWALWSEEFKMETGEERYDTISLSTNSHHNT